jgi:hypothetical protein
MAHVFLSLGQLAQVQEVANAAVSALDRQSTTPEVLSLRGAFRLVLAITAARDNDRSQAYAYLDRAREIAAQIGEDRNDFGTEFGHKHGPACCSHCRRTWRRRIGPRPRTQHRP